MQLHLNPYNPGSGLRPRVMGGREAEINAFDVLLERTKVQMTGRGMMLSGLRGVGKTVLLNYLRDQADQAGWLTVQIEGRPEPSGRTEVRDKLARELQISSRRYNGRSPRKALTTVLSTIQSFTVSIGATGVTAGIDVRPGRADSGRLDIDLEELIEDICTALKPDGTAFGVFIDEMQDLDPELLNALITVQHTAGQRDWPFYIIGAGLPNLPTALSEARTYAERLFDYRVIGPLEPDEARFALQRPAKDMNADFTPPALEQVLEASGRYPYFIQEFGKAIWEAAPVSPFTAEDADVAVRAGWRQLDSGFFPARWGRATPAERSYMRAMAVDGDEESSSGTVAERLGKPITSLGPTRAQLISKGLIYAPEHGRVAFTVPGMAGFIARQHED